MSGHWLSRGPGPRDLDSYLPRQGDAPLGRTSLPEPRLRDGTAQALDLLYLLGEYLLGLPLHLPPYQGIDVHGWPWPPRVRDMQLGGGTPGQADGSSGGQLRVL